MEASSYMIISHAAPVILFLAPLKARINSFLGYPFVHHPKIALLV